MSKLANFNVLDLADFTMHHYRGGARGVPGGATAPPKFCLAPPVAPPKFSA